ncbi:hypothetical protein NMG60_11023048 [Bertholletia excelsa]
MSIGDLLNVQPSKLKQSSCSMLLTNKTYRNVAFKVKTTNPKKIQCSSQQWHCLAWFCVQCNGYKPYASGMEFTMQAQIGAPPDMQCKDKFLIRSVVAQDSRWSMISKLTEEKASALEQNHKLPQGLELLKREISRRHEGGFSLMFVVLIGFLCLLLGFFLKTDVRLGRI